MSVACLQEKRLRAVQRRKEEVEEKEMRGQLSIFDGTEQSTLNQSIKLIQTFENSAIKRNPLGYVVGYSGGKDSDVLLDIFRKSGVRFYVIHNHTTLDAPETVYYIRRKFYELELQGIPCKIYYPQMNFWGLCLKKRMLPLRIARFCCAELKERDIPELRYATHSFGVRKAESVKRSKNRDSIEMRDNIGYSDLQKFHFDNAEDVKQTGACYTKNYFIVNPLAYWSDDYIWDYIHDEKLELNPLYKEGFKRVGCIGCPMARSKQRIYEFERYPKYKERFVKLADDIITKNISEGRANKYGFKNGQDYFDWWVYE